ncbi:zinc finger HIT domain-containing protein 3 isoform X3 [Procambarus clarkii]|uniref:zinc finger HIT domain-containing protein 3 isoform X3 n=1 Tax=Procambarus clarkii TaxID=6728 RepID=UPI0037445899
MDGVVNKCQVCTEAVSKYKCPKCRVKYCSVVCYKTHRQDECHASSTESDIIFEIDTQGSTSDKQILFPTDDTVMPKTLENLRSSSVLKTLLKNCHLREMIKEVDSAHKTDVVIQRAMMEPIFTEFVDVCLSIADPVKDEELESDEDM